MSAVCPLTLPGLTVGRRAHISPTRSAAVQVEAMAGYGVPEADIACVLEIDPKTLRRHYRVELDTGTSRPARASRRASTTRRLAMAPSRSPPRSSG